MQLNYSQKKNYFSKQKLVCLLYMQKLFLNDNFNFLIIDEDVLVAFGAVLLYFKIITSDVSWTTALKNCCCFKYSSRPEFTFSPLSFASNQADALTLSVLSM